MFSRWRLMKRLRIWWLIHSPLEETRSFTGQHDRCSMTGSCQCRLVRCTGVSAPRRRDEVDGNKNTVVTCTSMRATLESDNTQLHYEHCSGHPAAAMPIVFLPLVIAYPTPVRQLLRRWVNNLLLNDSSESANLIISLPSHIISLCPFQQKHN